MGIKLLFAKVMTAFWIYIEIKSLDETSMKMGNRSFWIVFKEFIEKMKGLKKDLNELIEDKKSDSKDKTTSSIKALNKEERIAEIAKMLSTGTPTETALKNAKELLNV